jgi:hypothetical protein
VTSIVKFFEGKSLVFIAFLQATAEIVYVGLVTLIFWKGETWFGNMNHYFGPLLLLTLFVVSALISALLVLGYPLILFWDQKKTKKALKLVGYTVAWLILFVLLLMLMLLLL